MTIADVAQICYGAHLAFLKVHHPGTVLRHGEELSPLEKDRWRMMVAVALAHPWASPELVRRAFHPNTDLTPWRRLRPSERAYWQMIADVARAWRGEVVP